MENLTLDLRAPPLWNTPPAPKDAAQLPWFLLPGLLHALPAPGSAVLELILPSEQGEAKDCKIYSSDIASLQLESLHTTKHRRRATLSAAEWVEVLAHELHHTIGRIVRAPNSEKALEPANVWEQAGGLAVAPFAPCPLVAEFAAGRWGDLEVDGSPTALDVGCAAGRDIAFLAREHKWRVTGIDTVDNVLFSAKRLAQLYIPLGAPRPELVHGTFRADGTFAFRGHVSRPPWASETSQWATEGVPRAYYAVVLMIRCLVRAALPMLAAAVRPGGYFVCHTFCTAADGSFPFSRPARREHLLTHGELARVFGKCGFAVLLDSLSVLPDGRTVNNFVARRGAHGNFPKQSPVHRWAPPQPPA